MRQRRIGYQVRGCGRAHRYLLRLHEQCVTNRHWLSAKYGWRGVGSLGVPRGTKVRNSSLDNRRERFDDSE